MTRKQPEMWLQIPNKECWWVGMSPEGAEVFALVEEVEDGVLVTWLPAECLLDDTPPGSMIVVYFHEGKSSDIIEDWRWKQIEIPDICPDFREN